VAAGGAESPERNASALDNAEVIGTPIDPATGMEFIRVPAGSFQMGDVTGDGAANEQPVHAVTLDEFFIGKFPVTQGQWTAVMSENPSKFQRGDDYPAEQVTWEDVEAFIRRLNEMNAGKFSFSLPSEAQWEYAARSGGKEEEYAGGNDLDALGWFQENSGGATHPVGKKAPNGLGIYDMSGNVWEWCADTFQENAYKSHASANPVCREPGPERALRGGSWSLDAWSARCARRFGFPTDYKGAGLGFRLVCKRT
jgi:formylglycine-generating enzyme required for sulfatase activity